MELDRVATMIVDVIDDIGSLSEPAAAPHGRGGGGG